MARSFTRHGRGCSGILGWTELVWVCPKTKAQHGPASIVGNQRMGENDEKTSGFWGSLLLDNHITWVYRINLCNVIYPHNVIWACRTVFPQDCQFSGFGYTVYISFAHTHVFCRDCGYKRQLSFTVYETPHTRIVGWFWISMNVQCPMSISHHVIFLEIISICPKHIQNNLRFRWLCQLCFAPAPSIGWASTRMISPPSMRGAARSRMPCWYLDWSGKRNPSKSYAMVAQQWL